MDDTLIDQQFLSDYVAECVPRVDRVERGLLAIEAGDDELESGLLTELEFLQKISDSTGFSEIANLVRRMQEHLASTDGFHGPPIAIETLLNACDYLLVHANAVSEGAAPPPVPRFDALDRAQTAEQRSADREQWTNRRRHRRFLDDVEEVEVCLKYKAKVRDESQSGISIEFSEPLPLRENQEVELVYKGHPMTALVRRSQVEPRGVYVVGLEWK